MHTMSIHKVPSVAVVASEKGVVVGRLAYREDGDLIDCQRMGVGGKAIPPNVDKVVLYFLHLLEPTRLACFHYLCFLAHDCQESWELLTVPSCSPGQCTEFYRLGRCRCQTCRAMPCSSCWLRRMRPSCGWQRTASTTPTPASSSQPKASQTWHPGPCFFHPLYNSGMVPNLRDVSGPNRCMSMHAVRQR